MTFKTRKQQSVISHDLNFYVLQYLNVKHLHQVMLHMTSPSVKLKIKTNALFQPIQVTSGKL